MDVEMSSVQSIKTRGCKQPRHVEHDQHVFFFFLEQKVTKGARHKIVISIQKLKERQNLLRSLEKVRVFHVYLTCLVIQKSPENCAFSPLFIASC